MPGLYMTAAWPSVAADLQATIRATASDKDELRTRAWNVLLDEADPTAIALALDIAVDGAAQARMGQPDGWDARMAHRAAWLLLSSSPIGGSGRFGDVLHDASHVVAVRTLAWIADPGDAARLARLPGRSGWSGELTRAWIAASSSILVGADVAAAKHLKHPLLSLAEDQAMTPLVKTEAISALFHAFDAEVASRLHAILETSRDDAAIEAAAVLGSHGALTDAEKRTIASWLAADDVRGHLAIRSADLMRALDP
ncbi:hypothetical protein M0208_11460 [Sphingomonas sp. SUN019]|uniref:hypothetical protein n=1 Tax=Sphingomonas sp. SUN019 TaxID=2937788 RepID=UPI0021649665|nr:hypothetical protein [Sphingomonas sp. SUN019]UVO51106.1 hypothetical protein M0208_11460 [Sphingomonas sp. SUN019]